MSITGRVHTRLLHQLLPTRVGEAGVGHELVSAGGADSRSTSQAVTLAVTEAETNVLTRQELIFV